ncbi:MAG: ankyrin repeat domain-containing protein [Endozoicomonas sp.]|uniref:ankyrin repeat domain-containing protein n=1 Tax=Endozoicomonas sp. TaxID=1892382 RepID=UPI003D9ACA87
MPNEIALVVNLFIDNCATLLHSGLLSKRRASDDNTPLHLLFARREPSLIKTLLDSRYHHIDQSVAITTNHAGISALQALLQNSRPVSAVAWLHQGNLEHKRWLKAVFDDSPNMAWPELFHRAMANGVMTPQIHWVRGELERAGLIEPVVEPSAPVLESSDLLEPLGSLAINSAPFKADLDQPGSELPCKKESSQQIIIFTDQQSMVVDKHGENLLHRLARECSPNDIEAIFTHNAETITPSTLSATNMVGQTPLDILIDREIMPGTVLPWLLHGLTDVAANELIDQSLFGKLNWHQLYDYVRLSSYVEKDKKLKQILELLEPIFTHVQPEPSVLPAPQPAKAITEAKVYMECPICMDSMEDNCVLTPCCDQIFHRACIVQWVEAHNNLCSHCRGVISTDQLRGVRAPRIVVEGGDEPEVINVRPKVNPEEDRSPADKGSAGAPSPDIDPTDYDRLRKAASKGDTITVLACIEAGMRLDVTDTGGNTLLHLAAENGHTDTALQLIEFGISLEARNKKQETAVLVAVKGNHADTVAALFGKGADLNIKDEKGCWAIYYAASGGNVKTVRVLIRLGVDLDRIYEDTRWFLAEYYGAALHIAAENGHTEIVIELLNGGADINNYQFPVDKRTDHGGTALELAASAGQKETVIALIERGAKVNPAYDNTWNALHEAAKGGHIEIVYALLDRGADLYVKSKTTALHCAARHGRTDIARILINLGLNVNCVNSVGETPLHEAVRGDKLETALMLIHHGALVSKRNKDGTSPLSLAKEYGSPQLAAELRKHDPCVIQ